MKFFLKVRYDKISACFVAKRRNRQGLEIEVDFGVPATRQIG
jgi:hypothetical protein